MDLWTFYVDLLYTPTRLGLVLPCPSSLSDPRDLNYNPSQMVRRNCSYLSFCWWGQSPAKNGFLQKRDRYILRYTPLWSRNRHTTDINWPKGCKWPTTSWRNMKNIFSFNPHYCCLTKTQLWGQPCDECSSLEDFYKVGLHHTVMVLWRWCSHIFHHPRSPSLATVAEKSNRIRHQGRINWFQTRTNWLLSAYHLVAVQSRARAESLYLQCFWCKKNWRTTTWSFCFSTSGTLVSHHAYKAHVLHDFAIMLIPIAKGRQKFEVFYQVLASCPSHSTFLSSSSQKIMFMDVHGVVLSFLLALAKQ